MPEEPLFDWYCEVDGDDLGQGDLLDNCPRPILTSASALPSLNPMSREPANLQVSLSFSDVIVLSQSCDLATGRLLHALVAPHYSLADFCEMNEKWRPVGMQKKLREGVSPGYHMINGYPSRGADWGPRVIDFRDVHALPVPLLREAATTLARSGLRMRLLPPYRERLSQAFARFIMRVGIQDERRIQLA